MKPGKILCSTSTWIAVMLLIVSGTLSAQDTNFRDRALRGNASDGNNLDEASLVYQNLHEPSQNLDKPNTDNENVFGGGRYAEGSPSKNRFYIILPDGNLIVKKSVTGYFPIHPYVFFDENSQDIPSRYTKLSTADARLFRVTDLGIFSKNEETDKEININELMIIYYNVLNIYGARMRDDPTGRVTLRSSDPDEREALKSANAVKRYLVNTFGIASSRISIAVGDTWEPSGSKGTNPDHTSMIDDENRRVKLVFSNQDMYKVVPYTITDPSPFENDMFVNMQNDVQFRSWSVAVTGENQTTNAGPFRTRTAVVDLTSIMHGLREGEFTASVTIVLDDGSTVTESTDFKVYQGDIVKNAARYLMVFDYNQSNSVWKYEKILREEFIPGIVSGNTVFVHGHTDIIGNEKGNQLLSQARADDVKANIINELQETDIDVNVIAVGIGQQKMQYTFDNNLPEGRMYNRNVFVEVTK